MKLKKYFENKMNKELDWVDSVEKTKHRRIIIKDINEKIEECQDPEKQKWLLNSTIIRLHLLNLLL